MLLFFQLIHLQAAIIILFIIVTAFLYSSSVQNLNLDLRKNYKREVERTLCQLGEVLPNGAFCLSKKDDLTKGWIGVLDGMLCKKIEKIVQNSSVVDFGAGLGQYGKCFLRNFNKLSHLIPTRLQNKNYYNKIMSSLNISSRPQVIKSYEGYDGALNIEEITNNFIKRKDLSTSFYLGRKFDWVLSLEVGEHIHKEAEDIFLSNLIKHSCKGIILSWAIPGQPGLEHVNTRTNEYIISKMAANGFISDALAKQFLSEHLYFVHFRKTIMVFRRTERPC